MSDDDRYRRFNLRIPKDLYARLMEAADVRSHSMNAEIIQRLESTHGPQIADIGAFVVDPSNPDRMVGDQKSLVRAVSYYARMDAERISRTRRRLLVDTWALDELERIEKAGLLNTLLESLAQEEEREFKERTDWLDRHPGDREKLERQDAELKKINEEISILREEQETLREHLREFRRKKTNIERHKTLAIYQIERDRLAEQVKEAERDDSKLDD